MATNNNDKKISQLPVAEPLSGAELVPVVQNGRNRRITVSDIASLGGTPGGTVKTVNGKPGPDVVLTASDIGAATILQGSKADTSEQLANKNLPFGYAGLDGSGKVPLSLLPDSLLELQGSWDANTNTPQLLNGTGNPGDVYVVSTSGVADFGSGAISFEVGDFVFYGADGKYFKTGNSTSVTSVNGKTGVVAIGKADVGLFNVDNTSDADKPISISTQLELNKKADLTSLALVAFTGSFTDLSNRPSFPDLSGLVSDVNELQVAVENIDSFISTLQNNKLIIREAPSGITDGINKLFQLVSTPVLHSEQVFLNGILQEVGESGDYTITGDQITFNVAPQAGWSVFVNYAADNGISTPVVTGGAASSFQWSSSEQIYPFEKASDGSTLFCKEIDMGFLVNRGGKSIPHEIQNYSASKIHSISGMIFNTVGSDAVAINSMAYGGNFCILDSVNVNVYGPAADWSSYKCSVRLIYSK